MRCTTIRIGKPSTKSNQVLVDGGITVNVLFLSTLLQLKLTTGSLELTSVSTRVSGNAPVPVIGTITLPITLEEASGQATYDVQFVVIKADSDYTAILEQSLLDVFQSRSRHFHP
ncbi:hypothetical protein KSP40_PGU016486 [Platanthera guangdongensis]|uniref:Uncharacterized protein n=1 Tax=Platanthera guangdongensis TaxID=2320717 RepID=A0ABR2M6S8_9ASPA